MGEENPNEKENDVDTRTNIDDFLTVRGFGGGYGGYGGYGGGGGYGHGGSGYYASPGANAVRINRNAEKIGDQADCTRTILGKGLDSVRDNFENLMRANDHQGLVKAISDSEFRGSDRLRDLERIVNGNAKDAAECCCELRALITAENARTREEMLKSALGDARDTNNIAATVGPIVAAIQTGNAALIAALNGNHGGH